MNNNTESQVERCYICNGEPYKTDGHSRVICKKHAYPIQQPIKYIAPIQGRNEKCGCGSGLKFKKCCWPVFSKHSQI